MKNLKKHNTEVSFWLITRNNPASHSGYVKNAKSAAREAAAQQGFNFEWNRLSGINV